MRLEIPELCLVVLVGPAGAGKSTFASQFFEPTEIVSSDACRALVADDETDQAATPAAFEVLHTIVRERLGRGRLTVVDATSLSPRTRSPLLTIAKRAHVPAVAIVFALPLELCVERDARRKRQVGREAIESHAAALERTLKQIGREGFSRVWIFDSADEVDEAEIVRVPLPSNKRRERGPFDVVGDVHGCYDELRELLDRLGWELSDGRLSHPEGRKLVFVGDLVDRGPKIAETLQLVMDAVDDGVASCVSGNHEAKLLRVLDGHKVRISGGLDETLEQLPLQDPTYFRRLRSFLTSLPSHLQFDRGRLVVAHAGLPRRLQGRDSPKVRSFALYGDTTGDVDELGYPVRRDWAAEYRAEPLVVYGHVVVEEPYWRNRSVDIDTGCVFGGKLTALRYPEEETVSVQARQAWAEHRAAVVP